MAAAAGYMKMANGKFYMFQNTAHAIVMTLNAAMDYAFPLSRNAMGILTAGTNLTKLFVRIGKICF